MLGLFGRTDDQINAVQHMLDIPAVWMLPQQMISRTQASGWGAVLHGLLDACAAKLAMH